MKNVRIYQLAPRTFTPEGTLRAAEKLLPHIASCGFTYVQLTPVVVADDDMDESKWSPRQRNSGMGNPCNNYRLKDYFEIDPEYGTKEDLLSFVRTAHFAGLKVLIDLVYLHTGPNATLVQEHPEWMEQDENGNILVGETWPFPHPNYAEPELREYMWSNMTYFVERFDVDGFRCDVGDTVPLDFWQEGIRRCKAIKQDFFMLNEGGNLDYLVDAFDCNYFWDGSHDSVKVSTGELSAKVYREKWDKVHQALPRSGRMLHFIDNHDICSDSFDQRHEKLIGNDGVEAQIVMLYTLDGVPFLFNGNEIADGLKHNMFSNRFHGRDDTVAWHNALQENGKRRMEVVKKLSALRDEHDVLNGASLSWLDNDCDDAVLSFLRPSKEETILVVINLRKEPVQFTLPIFEKPLANLMENRVCYQLDENGMKLQLLSYGYLIARL